MQHCIPFLSARVAIMATLGISTNTRLLGLAIINKDELCKYKMYLHKSSWSPSKANLIISSLEPCVRQYCIKEVVLSMPPQHHQTGAFSELRNALITYFIARGIAVREIPVIALYSLCPHDVSQNKKEVIKAVTVQFPQLRLFCIKELRNKNRYYTKLFEAVGVALLSRR